MEIKLEMIEQEYRKNLIEVTDSGKSLSAPLLIEISVKLFHELKVIDISNDEYADSDMLLFQYGVYNWGNDLGEHFSFDITRQILDPMEDEPYQLSIRLAYEPEQFMNLKAYNIWSFEFSNIEEFVAHIKTTEGYNLASNFDPKTYTLTFSQC